MDKLYAFLKSVTEGRRAMKICFAKRSKTYKKRLLFTYEDKTRVRNLPRSTVFLLGLSNAHAERGNSDFKEEITGCLAQTHVFTKISSTMLIQNKKEI